MCNLVQFAPRMSPTISLWSISFSLSSAEGGTGREVTKYHTNGKLSVSYRDVMICDGLVKDLKKLGNEHAHMFPRFRDQNKPMDNYRKALKTAVINSGVTRYGKPMRFTPKFGRKAFTSYQWIAGTPLELIRQMIGHSPNSKVTVKNYLHIPNESERAAVLDLVALATKGK